MFSIQGIVNVNNKRVHVNYWITLWHLFEHALSKARGVPCGFQGLAFQIVITLRTIHMKRNRNSVESKISPSLLFLAVVSNIKDKKDCKSFWQKNWSYCGKGQKSSHSSSAGRGRWHNLKPQPWQNRRDGCSPSRLFSDLRHVDSTAVLKAWLSFG